MSGLLNEVQRIVSEVRSEKPPSRNKAIEQLDEKLSNCRNDLNALLTARNADLTWPCVFEAAKEALFKHADSLQAANEKTFKTLAGKCYLYGNVLDKIVKFNLEAGLQASGHGHFLAKTSVFNAFEEGIKMRAVMRHFGDVILSLLDRGIYTSASYVRELKINEYSRILSYLFEGNMDFDDFLRTKIMKCITKTVSLAKDRVQLHADLAAYLPELSLFAKNANEARKTELVRLYFVFVSELSVNYHHQLCLNMQDILPKLCEFHNEDIYRDETRNLFFLCVVESLQLIYSKLDQCDFNTLDVPLQQSWPQTLMRLKTIVHMEIRKNSLVRYKTSQLSNDKFSEPFIRMSALVMYIVLWHLESRKPIESGDGDAPKKLARPADKMEAMFELIDKRETTFNDVWFAIFTELIQLSSAILNMANFQQAVSLVADVLQMHGNARNLRNVRLCLEVMLKKEQELIKSRSIQETLLADLWAKIGNHLISETTTNSEEIKERQLLLQMLIRHQKLSHKMVSSLLQSITSNEMLKRNECFATIREIFIHAGDCGLDKSAMDLEAVVVWAYGIGERASATQVIHNIAGIDAQLQADTFCIGIINFLDELQRQELARSRPVAADQNLLSYKYNKRLVCLSADYLKPFESQTQQLGETKNCLFQTNYECLMRNLNFKSDNDNQPSSIIKNLKSLYKLACTLERLVFYKVFDAETCASCPLIKRIGLFLSHIEFQYKANSSEAIDESDLREILQLQISVMEIFGLNDIMQSYLERQPLDMQLEFVGNALKLHAMRRQQSENPDHATITTQCLNILGGLCACTTYRDEAFNHILKVPMRWQPQDVLAVTKMLCRCESVSDEAINWLVNRLKSVFQHHYLDLNIIDAVVEHLPSKQILIRNRKLYYTYLNSAIFRFVCKMEHHLDDMLMALNSLLRIGLKKSYTSNLTAKIVRCVGLIALQCPDIYLVENFTVICKSTAKFITMPTLEVRFATLYSFMILFNTKCVASNVVEHSQSHWEFCQELYENIEFQKLTYQEEDAKRNSNAVVVQMLLAFVARSSFHQEIALKELIYHIALRKLTESEFVFLQAVVPAFGQSMRELIQPFADALLHKWASQRWPISKFPYFVCYETKEAFRNAHRNNILAYTFLYGQKEDVDRCTKSTNGEEALPLLTSFLLAKNSACTESESKDFQDHQQELKVNLVYSQLSALKTVLNEETLGRAISFLHDQPEVTRLLGPSVPLTKACNWYNLSAESLFKSLSWHIDPESTSRNFRIQSMYTLQVKYPRILVNLFGRLKTDCFAATFSNQVLRQFFLYAIIADAVYDAALALTDEKTVLQCSFFVRDIWSFVVQFLLRSKSVEVQMPVVVFLESLLNKPLFGFEEFSTQMAEMAKRLSRFQLHCRFKDVKERVMEIIKQILEFHKATISISSFLEETTECDFLQPMREEYNFGSSNIATLNAADYFRSFLKSPTAERLRDLREYIAKHKDELQENEKPLFEVINHLIRMARDIQNSQNAVDALKCLAQIGPLKLSNISYYFQADFGTLESELQPMDNFISIICETLEESLYNFDPNTYEALVCVAINVANSRSGLKIISKRELSVQITFLLMFLLAERFNNLQIFVDKSAESNYLNNHEQIGCIDWLAALKATQKLRYESWICAFVSLAFKDCAWLGFDTLAAKSFSFAKICLQPFIKLLLFNGRQHLDSLCKMLDYFFENFLQSERTQEIFHNKRAIKRFLDICECIRNCNNWSIPIKLSNVIKASNHCQAYFLSIMYLELWASSVGATEIKQLLDDETFQISAKKAYEAIGCLDAIPGFVNPMRSRLDFLGRSNNFSAVLLESDHLDTASGKLCVDIMKGNGLWSFAMLQQHKNSEPDYEIFWRLGQWDSLHDLQQQQPKPRTKLNLEQEFKRNHYRALRSISQREEENSLSAIDSAYQCVREILQENSVECLQSVYKYLTWLCSLQQAEDFCEIQFGAQLNVKHMSSIFKKWQTELDLEYGNFTCKEYVIAHQISLFKAAGTRAGRRMQEFYQGDPIDTYLLKAIEECKGAGKLSLAAKYIGMLREMADIKESTKISVLLEDAEINVKMGNPQIAKAILEHVTNNDKFMFCLQRVPALRMQGEFLMDCNADSLSSVQCHKFNAALKLIDDFVLHRDALSQKYPHIFQWQNLDAYANQQRTAAYASMAKYADREYQQLYDYRHSQDYQTLLDIIEQNRQTAGKVSQREGRDRVVMGMQMMRYANLDEHQLHQIEEKLTDHLCSAVSNHIAYCRLDSGFSSAAIYRIISLWFTNASNKKLQACIEEQLPTVPSHKFICAANQLTGRLNSKNTSLLKALVDLLVRCGQDHPYHIFYQLYPLVFAHLDGENSNTERAGIGRRIIAKICENNPRASECSKQLETVLPALVTFANEGKTDSKQGVPDSVRSKHFEKVRRLRNMDAVHCPTLELPVMSSKEYNITSVCKWSNTISQCGGLSAPVKVLCVCSDGQTRAQLIKGNDDLRQDAVMQQVFGIVNQLLKQDSEFIERKLHLRTYKVTPLSTRSGILEWCTNSIPVGVYLVGDGKNGAHLRYRPKDWTNNKCRSYSGSHLKSAKEKRLAIYREICEHLKPVFHYFLLEKFSIPGVWFERRLAYTNSVATTSMVGYVLGLGDRHTQNILIDQQTAEVIHIDFGKFNKKLKVFILIFLCLGIAFEQGKIQTTPETVPFRLTRDFVSPMGICGTKGVFAKSCEATMHILRRYKSVLTTILEVLLYDPLFIWDVLKKKQPLSQSGDPFFNIFWAHIGNFVIFIGEESVNLVAQRALLLVQNKLEGREAGTLGDSNVEAQVERLINEATLPSNLCMLFPGWDPYL
ncbi:hypothetical protein KR018_010145 [Drosophila ironensis]|nr:hypothetical protein KR018_010145 [Drosophila ironensis]